MSKSIPVKVLGDRGSPQGRRADSARQATVKPASPTGGKKHVELAPIHDFAAKLLQPELLTRLREYVRWQVSVREGTEDGRPLDASSAEDLARVPDYAPVSINLDITTACNYACDHCVDMDILNKAIKYNHDRLVHSLQLMAEKGLKSVIVIGGGEPTLYPKFCDVIRLLKSLGLQVAIVSNGSGQKKIAEIADCLDANDWVRLSLDAGVDDTFQKMHKPKRAIKLEEICAAVPGIKAINSTFKIGFSFIITWKGAFINDTHIVENLGEIVRAAELAREHDFDYISYKPFLTRAEENNAEIVDLRESDRHFDKVISRIRVEVDKAKKLATDDFSVYEATNLKVFENRSYRNYTEQPHSCHMQFFRQVLSPLGMYNCPVYRNQDHGHLGSKDAYATAADYNDTRRNTAEHVAKFDATSECREVTCLYNHVNWWIEDLIENPEKLDELEAATLPEPDFFM